MIVSLFCETDPQAWGIKAVTESIPTIKVELASPQSPESENMRDEFGSKASQPKESQEGGGLVMKAPSSAKERKDKMAYEDDDKEPQRLMRCLSDPGPAADEEDEDEPFLP